MEVLHDFPLGKNLYYKIGPTVKTVLIAKNAKDIQEAVHYLREHAISSVLPIGIGANLLFHDGQYDGVVLLLRSDTSEISLEGGQIKVFAGVLLDDVIHFALAHNYVGLGWAGGLPSTVGAGVRGNVGCFGKEIKDVIAKVDVLDLDHIDQGLVNLSAEELTFSYRNSLIKQHKNLLVVSVYFRLQKADDERVAEDKKMYQDNREYRKVHHPIAYPSCGSVFKNIAAKEQVERIVSVWPDIKEHVHGKWHGKVAMGYITKRLGLAGVREGGAEISEQHANYIVNKHNATFHDVITLIDLIKHKFHTTFGFYPEPEVEIIT